MPIKAADYLKDVHYEIRGEIAERAQKLILDGINITCLNIGNTAPFGFSSPDAINQTIIRNLSRSSGYCESNGIFPAREAIVVESQKLGIKGVLIDNVFIGNGVSELISLSINALVNPNDEILLPSPNYPLWSAAVSSARGKPVFYHCLAENSWEPDLKQLESSITKNTKALVIITPNNPTGSIYTKDTLLKIIDIARQHNLILFADEIYSKIIFDDNKYVPIASLSEDVLTISFNGLSKNYRSCGFRVGWMFLSGPIDSAKNYIQGIKTLASMRLCSNVPGQWAIQTALGGYQSIEDICSKNGRLYKQRELFHQEINKIEGLHCIKPQGTIYLFVSFNEKLFSFKDDKDMTIKLLEDQHILIAHGTGLDYHKNNAFRIVFLPYLEEVLVIIKKFNTFFNKHRINKKS